MILSRPCPKLYINQSLAINLSTDSFGRNDAKRIFARLLAIVVFHALLRHSQHQRKLLKLTSHYRER